jgi:hypothetical protein
MPIEMVTFLHGAAAAGFSIAGLCFVRFWRQSRDTLFLLFALAFWLLAVDRIVLGLVTLANEVQPYVFLLRLAAFCLILFAIYDKNRRPSHR